MEAPRLLFQKNFRQTCHGNFLPEALLTDIEILTEHTAQIAMAEKHRSAALCAADGRFFPIVAADESHLGQVGGTAEPCLTCGTVDAAVSGADLTMRQSLVHFLH